MHLLIYIITYSHLLKLHAMYCSSYKWFVNWCDLPAVMLGLFIPGVASYMSFGSHTTGGNLGKRLILWLLISVHPSAICYFQLVTSLLHLENLWQCHSLWTSHACNWILYLEKLAWAAWSLWLTNCFIVIVGLFKHYFFDQMLTKLILTAAFYVMSDIKFKWLTLHGRLILREMYRNRRHLCRNKTVILCVGLYSS